MAGFQAFFAQYRTAFMLIILILAAYFFMIRPQKKQRKEREEMMSGMKIGDEVMTAGGFYGIIYAIDDDNVVLEMLPDFNKLMVRRASIVKVITAEEAEANRIEEVDDFELDAADYELPEETEGEDS